MLDPTVEHVLKKKLGAGVGAGSGQYGLFLQKWTQNGQKWPEMARNGLISPAIFCKCSTQLASMFLEKYFFGPDLFGGRGRANKVFFFAKMEPNGQKWPQIRGSGGGAKTCK